MLFLSCCCCVQGQRVKSRCNHRTEKPSNHVDGEEFTGLVRLSLSLRHLTSSLNPVEDDEMFCGLKVAHTSSCQVINVQTSTCCPRAHHRPGPQTHNLAAVHEEGQAAVPPGDHITSVTMATGASRVRATRQLLTTKYPEVNLNQNKASTHPGGNTQAFKGCYFRSHGAQRSNPPPAQVGGCWSRTSSAQDKNRLQKTGSCEILWRISARQRRKPADWRRHTPTSRDRSGPGAHKAETSCVCVHVCVRAPC